MNGSPNLNIGLSWNPEQLLCWWNQVARCRLVSQKFHFKILRFKDIFSILILSLVVIYSESILPLQISMFAFPYPPLGLRLPQLYGGYLSVKMCKGWLCSFQPPQEANNLWAKELGPVCQTSQPLLLPSQLGNLTTFAPDKGFTVFCYPSPHVHRSDIHSCKVE